MKNKLIVPVVILQSDTNQYYVSQDNGYVTTTHDKKDAKVFDDLNILNSMMSGLPRCHGNHSYTHIPATDFITSNS